MLKEKEWYNAVYENSTVNETLYSGEAEQMPYFGMWETCIKWILPNTKIYDFGCGTGQFDDLATRRGIVVVGATDFSATAIRIAKKRNQKICDVFSCGDLMSRATYGFGDYSVAVLLEVLEHVEDDMFVLDNIPAGKRVIFSLPSFESESHVRHFPLIEMAEERYGRKIKIIRQKAFCVDQRDAIWLFDAVK